MKRILKDVPFIALVAYSLSLIQGGAVWAIIGGSATAYVFGFLTGGLIMCDKAEAFVRDLT